MTELEKLAYYVQSVKVASQARAMGLSDEAGSKTSAFRATSNTELGRLRRALDHAMPAMLPAGAVGAGLGYVTADDDATLGDKLLRASVGLGGGAALGGGIAHNMHLRQKLDGMRRAVMGSAGMNPVHYESLNPAQRRIIETDAAALANMLPSYPSPHEQSQFSRELAEAMMSPSTARTATEMRAALRKAGKKPTKR